MRIETIQQVEKASAKLCAEPPTGLLSLARGAINRADDAPDLGTSHEHITRAIAYLVRLLERAQPENDAPQVPGPHVDQGKIDRVLAEIALCTRKHKPPANVPKEAFLQEITALRLRAQNNPEAFARTMRTIATLAICGAAAHEEG